MCSNSCLIQQVCALSVNDEIIRAFQPHRQLNAVSSTPSMIWNVWNETKLQLFVCLWKSEREKKLYSIKTQKHFKKAQSVYQSSGWNPDLWSPQTLCFLLLLQTPHLHRPLNVATVPLKDGAQPLQQNHAGGASHGATKQTCRGDEEASFFTFHQVDERFELYPWIVGEISQVQQPAGFRTTQVSVHLRRRFPIIPLETLPPKRNLSALSGILLCAAQPGWRDEHAEGGGEEAELLIQPEQEQGVDSLTPLLLPSAGGMLRRSHFALPPSFSSFSIAATFTSPSLSRAA